VLNRRLTEAIAAAAGVAGAEDLHLVQCSSRGATGAIILYAWAGRESTPRAIVKTPRDARLNHSLDREWDAVRALRTERGLAQLIPAALATTEIEGTTYFIYQGAAGRTMYSRFRNRVVWPRALMLERFAQQALDPLLCVHETRSRQAASEEVAQDLLRDLAWLENTLHTLPSVVAEKSRAAANRIAASRHSLPAGRIHGDYSPYNLLTGGMAASAAVRLIDWEHCEQDRPQHIDVFRFMAACVLMGRRGGARRLACRTMGERDVVLQRALLRPWLDRMSASGSQYWMLPKALEALWWHYWIHAARREQERSATPHDWRDSTYVNALVTLASRSDPTSAVSSTAYAT
jgi:hypothetical protein